MAEETTGKTLIVYFSQTGNTEGLANLIHEMSGADIFRLERRTPYSSSSSGIGSSATNLHSLASAATWMDGQRFSGSSSRSAVETWVNGLGLTLTPAAWHIGC